MVFKLTGPKDEASAVLIAAKYAGVKIEHDAAGKGNNVPSNKPLYLTTDEGSLFESNTIARFVAGTNSIAGGSAFEKAQVSQWLDYTVYSIDMPAAAWLYPIKGLIQENKDATQRARGDIRKALKFLDDHLKTQTFLVGERISLADIVVAARLVDLYKMVLDDGFRKQFVNTNRWFTTLINQENFSSVLGKVDLCKKMQAAVASAQPKEQPKKQQQQPKKQEKKQEKKPEADDEPKPVKKGKNPLDLLPPTKFILDSWKKVYSNEDTRAKAIPWFWDNVDLEGYSMWFCDYKYNEDNEKVFMTCNLVGGFLQRLDALRKYGFGSMLIFGEEGSLIEISGVWLVRGKELPAEMTECSDAEMYSWRRVNEKDSKDKELVNDYLAWDGELGGKKFNQGKVFK